MQSWHSLKLCTIKKLHTIKDSVKQSIYWIITIVVYLVATNHVILIPLKTHIA